MATSAATDSRGAFWAVTRTTGVRPRRPQVRPFGGLEPRGRTRLRRLPRRPGPPRSMYLRPGLLSPGGDLLLVALRCPAGGHLHAPPEAVQQQVQPGQGVVHAEALADDLGDARQRPALVGPAPRRRAGVQQGPPPGSAGGGGAGSAPRPAPWRPAPGGRRRPAPGAT